MATAFGVVRFARRGIRHYLREHILVAVATGVAVAVLVGALVVGDSVRGSLRAAFTQRLGATDYASSRCTPLRRSESGWRPDWRPRRLTASVRTPVPIYRLQGPWPLPMADASQRPVFGGGRSHISRSTAPPTPSSRGPHESSSGIRRLGFLRGTGC